MADARPDLRHMIAALRKSLGSQDTFDWRFVEPSLLDEVPSITTYGNQTTTVEIRDSELERGSGRN